MLHPVLLLDNSKLPEISKLRVDCYTNSEYHNLINAEKYPNGWFDKLDDTAVHWTIYDKEKLIASCRLAFVTDLTDIEEDFLQFSLPRFGHYAFFSRLVILKEYRNLGLTHKMDNVRFEYIRGHNFPVTLAWARQKRLHSLFAVGFKELGKLKLSFGDTDEIVTALKLEKQQ